MHNEQVEILEDLNSKNRLGEISSLYKLLLLNDSMMTYTVVPYSQEEALQRACKLMQFIHHNPPHNHSSEFIQKWDKHFECGWMPCTYKNYAQDRLHLLKIASSPSFKLGDRVVNVDEDDEILWTVGIVKGHCLDCDGDWMYAISPEGDKISEKFTDFHLGCFPVWTPESDLQLFDRSVIEEYEISVLSEIEDRLNHVRSLFQAFDELSSPKLVAA